MTSPPAASAPAATEHLRVGGPSGDLAVVGCVRDGAATVAGAVRRIAAALPAGCRVHWMVIESDSADDTASVLDLLKSEINGFDWIGLGRLADRHPLRADRIAHCRNAGIEWFESLRSRGLPVSHLVMADLDGVNDGLTSAAFASCWARDDWDGCMANQAGRYYDLWALRHPVWCPGDCWAEAAFLMEHGVQEDRAKMAAVFTRMLTIAPEREWIEVHSAFGGMAVYRADAITGLRYSGLTPSGAEVCEHVGLHEAMRARGSRLYINPRFVNGRVGDEGTYWAGPPVARRHAASLRLRVALWLAFGRKEAKALRRLVEGLR